ncbi:MAG: PIN domain-containing protein [Verrucomicrobia bacterium]|jgi:toxin-antitoxin system PIN domain toxin|nr:PIN domain-containing protein [Verrucomicrobiota bacterium]
MILPDANLLLYAVNRDSPDHEAALTWWRNTLESGEPVRLTSGVVFAFVRLATNRKVFTHPLTPAEAFDHVENWLEFPSVELAESLPEDLPVIRQLLEAAGTGGNLVSDAQIAAVAKRLEACVYSADDDFDRFPEIRWQNPLVDRRSRK